MMTLARPGDGWDGTVHRGMGGWISMTDTLPMTAICKAAGKLQTTTVGG